MKFGLTEKIIDKIVDKVSIGNYPVVAAQAQGVTDTTYYRWIKQGESILQGFNSDITEDTLYDAISCLDDQGKLLARIVVEVKRAEAIAECRDVAIISLGDKTAIPILAKLSRRHPDRWSDRRGDEEAFEKGIAFLGKLADVLKKPPIETTEAPVKPLELT